MVCHNCHGEIHAGLISIPENIKRFDENFATYEQLAKSDQLNNCPICNVLKPTRNKFCSLNCSGKNKFKTKWDTIDLLNWLKTSNISEAAIRKRAKKIRNNQ